MAIEATIFFLCIVVYGLFASRFSRWQISMPLFFVIVGALLGDFTAQYSINIPGAELLTEITLTLLLFADASTLSFRRVVADTTLPERLLLLGLFCSIVLGGLTAFVLFPGQGIWIALLLASILAPTDAALGLPIFNNQKVPVRIRRALNVESGLNDGIASPFVVLFIALSLVVGDEPIEPFLLTALTEIAIAILVAIVVGIAGGKLFALSSERKWTTLPAQQTGAAALAIAAYASSVALGGNGFIAAFVAGLLFGRMTHEHAHAIVEFAEVSGTLLSIFVWTIFGSSVAFLLLQQFDVRALIFAILTLTFVRMTSVAIAMIGVGLRRDTIALMGWFGPRGLASVVFLLIAVESFHAAGLHPELLTHAAGWTILLSVILHGVTAQPLANWYARRLANAAPDIPELADAPEITVRGR